MSVQAGTQVRPGWALDRLDQRAPGPDHHFTYPATGAGVTVFLADTGVRTTHSDLTGRVRWLLDGPPAEPETPECQAHGTHLAGLVAGRQHGVAKNAEIVTARVTDCAGHGEPEALIAALDHIGREAMRPAVILLSLDYGLKRDHPKLAAAIERRLKDGQVVVAAAGDSLSDTCARVPAGVPGVITVGATDAQDRQPLLSNFGRCVDLLAPGVDVASAGAADDRAVQRMSGSSQAAALVAGAAALVLQDDPTLSPRAVRERLRSTSLQGAVRSAPTAKGQRPPVGLLQVSPALLTPTTRQASR